MSFKSFGGWGGHVQGEGRGAGGEHAFTLIELLTVISIIAVVAGLVVGLAPTAARQMRERRVEGDLNQLVTAIEQYHAVKGYYPPDNLLTANPPVVNAAINPLYYELKGWTYTRPSSSVGVNVQNGVLYTGTLQTAFHRGGIANSSATPNDPNVKDFLPNLRPSQVANNVPVGGARVDLLIVPVPGPGGLGTNTWHYVSTSPTNNPGKFDLWAEVQLGKTTKIIGNWKE